MLHEIHADAPRVNADRLQQLAAWLVKLPTEHAHDVIDSRLQRVHELRTMLADADWDSDEATRARIGKLLAYIDREDDLIADRTPLLGQLDDVLLIELAWPAFADDAEDYRDFCDYRRIAHPQGPPPDTPRRLGPRPPGRAGAVAAHAVGARAALRAVEPAAAVVPGQLNCSELRE